MPSFLFNDDSAEKATGKPMELTIKVIYSSRN